jgi:hypothetical protein
VASFWDYKSFQEVDLSKITKLIKIVDNAATKKIYPFWEGSLVQH